MAAPLSTSKRTVNLASDGPRVSRIRRDPPAKASVKELNLDDPTSADPRLVMAGVVGVMLVIVAIVVGVCSAAGWTPRAYTVFF